MKDENSPRPNPAFAIPATKTFWGWKFGPWKLEMFWGDPQYRQSPGMTLYCEHIDGDGRRIPNSYFVTITTYSRQFSPTLNALMAEVDKQRNDPSYTPVWPEKEIPAFGSGHD